MFELKLTPVVGMSLADCCADASRLAAQLGLHNVNFEANGERWCIYPDGRGIEFTSGTKRRWSIAQGLYLVDVDHGKRP